MKVNIDISNILEAMNKAFHFLLVDKNRFILLRGGAGSSKSYSVIQALLFKILYNYDSKIHNILLLRKTLPAAKKSILPLLKKIMSDWGINSELVSENKTDLTYTFTNGSMITIDSLQDPERIKSIFGLTDIMMEEGTEFSLDDFNQLNLRLRGDSKANYQIYIPFNPVSKYNWIYKRFYTGESKDTTLHHSTYKDNRFLDKAYKDQLEQLIEQDKTLASIYLYGEWATIVGCVYSNWKIIDKWPDEIQYYYYGVDWGFVAPSTIIRCALEGTNVFVEEMFYEHGTTNEQVIEFIKGNLEVESGTFYADSAEPQRIKQCRNHNINMKKADKQITDGIDFLKRYKINVVKNSTNIINELGTYKYPDVVGEKEVKEVPIKFADHTMDAIRYCIWTHYGKKRTFGIVT